MQYQLDDNTVINFDLNFINDVEVDFDIELPILTISHEETPTISPLEIIDYGSSSIECAFDVATQEAEEVVKGVLCGTTNPPTFENADYRLLHGQGSMDLVFAGLRSNTEYYLRPYALSNLGYKYGDVVAQRTKVNPIPEEYQLVEYLRSTGTQYIQLNFIPNAKTKWTFEYQFLEFVQSQNGVSSYAPQDRFIICCENHFLYVGMGEGSATSFYINEEKHEYVLDSMNNKYGIDGIFYTYISTFRGRIQPICLFARRQGNEIRPFSSGMLYHTKLEEESTIKINAYPVYRKLDNKPGLYDRVNNQFYVNQGSGEFIVGPDKEWEE